MAAEPGLAAALAGRYTIERELGQGGMATVYLAHDLKHDRQVAIKVLRPELSAAIGAERFLAEIKTTAALQHPHILGLIDSGKADVESRKSNVEGSSDSTFDLRPSTLYYVMPYIEGETLRDKLNRETQLPVEEAVRIASDVADALDYAHRHGVIHRDIKPENILLHDGRPMVADFGIALPTATDRRCPSHRNGPVAGDPAVHEPRAGHGRARDRRAERYLRAGQHAVRDAPGPPALQRPQCPGHRGPDHDRRSTLPDRSTAHDPPSVDRAVRRALERLPADRFATTAGFAAALHGSSDAAPSGWRRRVLAGGGVALALVLLTAGVYMWKGRRTTGSPVKADRSRVVAVLPFRNISADTAQQYFSAGMTEEITSQLAKVASLRVLGRSATAQYDTVANRLQRMASDLGVGSVVEGSVRLAGDRVRIDVELTDVQSGQSLWSDQYERQIADIFAVQDDVALQVTSALQAALTPSEAKRLAHAPTSSPAAHQIYLRALTLHPSTAPITGPRPNC